MKQRTCKRKECGKKFKPTLATQIYCSLRCGNDERQKRLRERAKIGGKR